MADTYRPQDHLFDVGWCLCSIPKVFLTIWSRITHAISTFCWFTFSNPDNPVSKTDVAIGELTYFEVCYLLTQLVVLQRLWSWIGTLSDLRDLSVGLFIAGKSDSVRDAEQFVTCGNVIWVARNSLGRLLAVNCPRTLLFVLILVLQIRPAVPLHNKI